MNPHNGSLRPVLRINEFTDVALFRNSCSSFHLCSSLSLENELIITVSPLKDTHAFSLEKGSLVLDDMNFQIAK